MKMLYKFVILRSLSSPMDSIQDFDVNLIPFLISQCFLTSVHLLIAHLSLFISVVLKISEEIRVSIANSFKLSRGCYLIQAI